MTEGLGEEIAVPKGWPQMRDARYGWVILAVCTLTVMGSLGFARFGYAMILPEMQASLQLSNAQTGSLATGAAVGYLLVAVVGGFLAARHGARRLVSISMLVVGATMILTGVATDFGQALLLRTLTGMGSGGSNVPAMALLAAWFAPRRRGLASGIAVTGSSLGLIITGQLIPWILGRSGAEGWRTSWIGLGIAVMSIGLLGWWLLRESPEFEAAPTVPKAAPGLEWSKVFRSGAVWHLGLVYFAFGLSYVVYVTFFVKYLVAEGGHTAEAAGDLWALVGWLSLFCGVLSGALSDLVGRKYGLALVFLVHAASYGILALWHHPTGYLLSSILFGLVAWSIPGVVSAACGDYVGSRLAPAALGFLTLFFGVGQAAGPSIAGALADAKGSFSLAFLAAAGVALAGGAGSLLLRDPEAEWMAVKDGS